MGKGIKLRILDLGQIICDRKELIRTNEENTTVISPMEAVLIRHPDVGYILYDTGNDPQWRETYTAEVKNTYPVSNVISIAEALEKEGLTVNDINVLILSHLHFDHAGGLKFFSGTSAGKKVIVSEAELKDVKNKISSPDQNSGAYIGKLFYGLPGIGFETIKERYELAEGISLFVQPCHTAGVIGMEVHLPHRTILFTGDTVYLREAYEDELPPGGKINKTDMEFYENLKYLKKIQKKLGAEVFYGHDFEQAKTWGRLDWID